MTFFYWLGIVVGAAMFGGAWVIRRREITEGSSRVPRRR